MKALKFFAVTLASLLLVLLVFISLLVIQPNWFKQPITRLINDQSGLQVSLGRIDSGVGPASLQLQNVAVAHRGQQLLNAEQVRLELTDWPSLEKPFFRLALASPQVIYSLDKDGNSNWPQSSAPKEDSSTSPLPFALPGDFAFENILIEDGDIQISLPAQQRHITLPLLQLERTAENRARLAIRTAIDGEAFELDGEFTLSSAHQLALDLALSNNAMQTRVDASLSTRAQMDGSAGKVSFSLSNTAFISRLLGVEIPELPEARLTTRFGIDSHYRLSDLELQLGDQALSGNAVYSPTDHHLSATLRSDHVDLDALLALFQSEAIAEAGTEVVEKEITEPPAKPEQIGEAQIDWSGLNAVNLDADIVLKAFSGQQWRVADIDAKIVIRGDKKRPRLAVAASTGKILQNTENGYALDSVSLDAEFTALDLQTQGADADAKLKLAVNEHITLNAEGRANLNALEEQELTFQLAAPSTLTLWQAAKLPYTEAGALNVEGKLSSLKGVLSPALIMQLGDQRLNLDASYTPGDRPKLTASVSGKDLDIRFLSPEQTSGTAEKPKTDATKKPLFSRDTIDNRLLREMDAEVAFDIQGLTTPVNRIDEISLIAQLNKGKLTTRNSQIKLPDNDLNFSFSGNFTENDNRAQTELTFNSRNVGALGLEEAAQIRGGHGKVELKLASHGTSAHALASNLNGKIDTRLQDLTMDNNKVDLIGSDWITEAITKLNPFAKSDPVTQLECVSVYFDVKNGVMVSEKNLHVETSKMKIIGDGEVDLGKERMTLNFTPIARKGLGVNLSYLAKLVKIHGDIQSPKLGVDAGGLFSSALSTSAAMATGGASLIAQSLVERAMNAGSACDPSKKIELAIPEPEPESPADGTAETPPAPEAP